MLESNTKREISTMELEKEEAEAGDTTAATSHHKVSTHIPKHRLIPNTTKSKHRFIPTTTLTKPKQLSSPSSRRQLPLGWTSKQESPPDHGDKNSASSASPSIMQLHAMQKESTELKLPPDDKDELKSYQRRKSSVVTSQQHQSKASSSVPKRKVQITIPSQKQKQSEKRNNPPPKEELAQLPTRQQKSLAEQRRRVARNQTP